MGPPTTSYPALQPGVVMPALLTTSAGMTAVPLVPQEQSAPPSKPVRAPRPPRFTLQLLAGRHRKDLEAFVEEIGLDVTKTYILHGTHKGGSWYRLLYGGYRSHRAARTALSALPDAVKRHRPWVRPMPATHTTEWAY